MSLTFVVLAAELPPFNDVVAAAALTEPLQLAGAGFTGAPWPKGLFPPIVDAAQAPSKLDLSPEVEASFARAGVSGSLIAFLRGASRGVVIAQKVSGIAFHVPLFASLADYRLATRLAAAAARIATTTVTVSEADGGDELVTPAALLDRYSDDAVNAHAARVGTWLADDIAQGRTYFFQGPHGFVALGPNELGGVPEKERCARARGLLAGGTVETHDARRDAVLLTAAMVFAAGADGVLADEEARQLEAHFATVGELRSFLPRDLMSAVRTDVGGLAALGELGAPLRRKAFVLAGEVIASARDGKLGGEATDPNVAAVDALAKALLLDDDQMFLAQVVRTVVAKYEASPVDDDLARSLVLSMILTAAADGTIDEHEAAVLSALARTVPELRGRDVGALFSAAKSRVASAGLDAALGDLTALSGCRNKCFALATEVALVSGKGPADTLLPRIRERIAPDADYAEAAIATFAAKYA